MISHFLVGNFLSFKDTFKIAFEPTSLKDTTESIFSTANSGTRVLKSVSIYGSNASGKSNFLKAFNFMKNWVLNSFTESNRITEVPIEPYLLLADSEKTVSIFEIAFYIDEIKFRYGFKTTKQAIDEEWLFYSEPKKREQNYFIRKEQEISLNSNWKRTSSVRIEPIISYVKPRVLFISVLSQFNIDVGTKVIDWFNRNIIAFNISDDYFINKAASLLNIPEFSVAIHHLIQQARLGFSSIEHSVIGKYSDNARYSNEFVEFIFQDEINEYQLKTKHNVYNEKGNLIDYTYFDFRSQESAGTQKFFALIGFFLLAIKQNSILWIDELDSKFHPNLFQTIIKFFNSNKYNHRGAQLIFTTHSTHLLKDRILRRDQIFTVDKNEKGESSIQGASETNVRSDVSYEKQYFDGKYGGIQKIDLDNVQLDLF